MKKLNNSDRLDAFARQTFGDATSHVSANTHYRLEQAVNAAVRAPAQLNGDSPIPHRQQWQWFGIGIGGGALLASVVGLMVWNPFSSPEASSVAPVAVVSVSMDPVVWSADLDEDPSMYAWLASKEALAVAR